MSAQNKLTLHQLRIRLPQTEALVPLTLLGLLTGALAGGLLIIFRESVSFISQWVLPSPEVGFAQLNALSRFCLPLAGAILLTGLIKIYPENRRHSAVTALLTGVMATAFIRLNLFAARQRRGHTALPLLIAGLLMGCTGFLIPQAMGMGYDSLNIILNGGSLDWSFLIILLISKITMTALVTAW